jgi:hypothetical protein
VNRITIRPKSGAALSALILLAGLACLLLPGCGQAPGYPRVTPVSALNHPGLCANCGRKIDLVRQENLITIHGIEYIVCDETCAKGQEKLVANQ